MKFNITEDLIYERLVSLRKAVIKYTEIGNKKDLFKLKSITTEATMSEGDCISELRSRRESIQMHLHLYKHILLLG
jgi:hypothetical protein